MEPITIYSVRVGDENFWVSTQAKAIAFARELASVEEPEDWERSSYFYNADGSKVAMPTAVYRTQIIGGRPREVVLSILKRRGFVAEEKCLGSFEPRGKRPIWHAGEDVTAMHKLVAS